MSACLLTYLFILQAVKVPSFGHKGPNNAHTTLVP